MGTQVGWTEIRRTCSRRNQIHTELAVEMNNLEVGFKALLGRALDILSFLLSPYR